MSSRGRKPAKKPKKGTRGTDWVTANSDAIRAQLPGEGEHFGIVIQILGASILLVKCIDGFTRQIRIPGKYRKRLMEWTQMKKENLFTDFEEMKFNG